MQIRRLLPLRMDFHELKSASFWLAQGLMVLATIVGVYLASSEGFRKALEFYAVSQGEGTYQVLRSLRAELTANLERVEAFSAASMQQLPEGEDSLPRLQRYIWTSLNQSDKTYELPVDVLNGVYSYYHAVERLGPVVVNPAAWANDRRGALKRLQAESDLVRQQVLPAVDAAMQALAARLKPYGLPAE